MEEIKTIGNKGATVEHFRGVKVYFVFVIVYCTCSVTRQTLVMVLLYNNYIENGFFCLGNCITARNKEQTIFYCASSTRNSSYKTYAGGLNHPCTVSPL